MEVFTNEGKKDCCNTFGIHSSNPLVKCDFKKKRHFPLVPLGFVPKSIPKFTSKILNDNSLIW
jgi:hypothetical protein